MKNKNLAFTLAETLIVIAIIGVVASLTLPNLNSSTADKEKLTKVKKIYAALTEATDRAQAIYGPMDSWFNGLATDAEKSKRLKDRVTEFMKVSKDCGQGTGCWATVPLHKLNGNAIDEGFYQSLNGSYFVNLADGTSLAFTSNTDTLARFRVDIDGANKGKTQIGNDIFDFTINDNTDEGNPRLQLIPSRYPTQWSGNLADSYLAAWIIQNDNLDYLKCNDLNWETKTSCN